MALQRIVVLAGMFLLSACAGEASPDHSVADMESLSTADSGSPEARNGPHELNDGGRESRGGPGTPVWAPRGPASPPAGRARHAMAYDKARGKVVLFGGTNYENCLEETWEWDGTSWLQRNPASSPQARADHAMAYDAARHKVILFSGRYDSWQLLDDTWEWDGISWVQLRPASSPQARADHAMAYDAARRKVVLFGGKDDDGNDVGAYVNDTWEWDGTSWAQLRPASMPRARADHSMAYHDARGKVVLFGGYGADGDQLDDTWTLHFR